MNKRRTAVRNREIYGAYLNRQRIEDLANRYGLSAATINEIVRIERHKIAVSADGFYEQMRSRNPRTQFGYGRDSSMDLKRTY